MPRPNKILEETKAYNLNLKTTDYDKLSAIAHEESAIHNMQVSVADLMREAIDIYLSANEKDDEAESE